MPKDTKVKDPSNRRGYIKNTNFVTKPAHNERSPLFYLEDRRKRVLQQYIEGKTQWEIARNEKVDQATVFSDLQVAKKKYDEYFVQTIDQQKKEELARLDRIEEQLWEAWHKSCKVEEIVTVENTIDKDGNTIEKKRVVTKQLIGDPRYMERIQSCIDQRCKILGITKDIKINNTNLVAIPWDQIVTSTGGVEINNELAALRALPTKVNDNEDVQSSVSSTDREE